MLQVLGLEVALEEALWKLDCSLRSLVLARLIDVNAQRSLIRREEDDSDIRSFLLNRRKGVL